MRGSSLLVGLSLAIGLCACGDDETVFGADGGSSSGGGHSSSGSGGAGGDGAGGRGGAAVYGVGNVDDDDLDGQPDWLGGWVEVDNDLAQFTLPDDFRAEVQAGHTLELSLSGDVDAIRVWHDGESAWHKLPDNRPLVAQYYVVLEGDEDFEEGQAGMVTERGMTSREASLFSWPSH